MEKEQTVTGFMYKLRDATFYVHCDFGVRGYSWGERDRLKAFPSTCEFKHENKLPRIEELLELCSTRADVELVFHIPPVETLDRDAVRSLMASSKSETEWNSNADKVRDAFVGEYPGFWYADIMLSGLAGHTRKGWK